MRIAQTLRYLIGPLELIHEQAGPRLLRLTRLGVFALWIVKLLLDPIWRLAEMPREMFAPVGILNLFSASELDALLRPGGLTFLLIATITVLVLGLTNRAFPFIATLAALLLTVYSSVIRSFGPAVHTDIVLLFAVYVLAAFAWADLLQAKLDKRESPVNPSAVIDRRYRWSSYPLITIVVLLCLSYMLVGFNRTVAGGIRVFTGDTMEVWAIDASLRGYFFNTNIGWHVPEWPFVALMLKLGLPGITVFEMTAPLCLACPHYRLIFIPTMISFHLLSLVFMNIFFFDDMLLYFLLIDWSRRFPALSSRAN